MADLTSNPQNDLDVLRRMLERERRARAAAEKFLEFKSLELYEANQNLASTMRLYERQAAELKAIFDSVTDGILTINQDGNIESANASVGRIFGTDHLSVQGTDIRNLIIGGPNLPMPSVENQFYADLCTANHPTIESIGQRQDGRAIEIELSASARGAGSSASFVWVVRDISKARASRRQTDLNLRLQGIGQLAAGVAHEINTPIQFIHENANFLAEAFQAMEHAIEVYEQALSENDLKATVEQSLNSICTEEQLNFYRVEIQSAIHETQVGSKRIAAIVGAIKEFSHPGTTQKTKFDVNRIIRSAVTVCANHWKQAAEISLNLQKDSAPLTGFASEISQVVVNLIVNAADAILERQQSDRSPGKISIVTCFDSTSFILQVSDNGCGIPPDNLQKVFLPFYTTKPVGRGTGQGLSIAHTIIVKHHNGSIEVDSSLGRGTTFVIRIPLHNTPVAPSRTLDDTDRHTN